MSIAIRASVSTRPQIIAATSIARASGVSVVRQLPSMTARPKIGPVFDSAATAAAKLSSNLSPVRLSASMVAASVNGETSHVGVDFVRPSLILMGNEQAGLPPHVEAQCDTLCLIPMRGGADSLNLAQATAIMLYEGWRQRGFA